MRFSKDGPSIPDSLLERRDAGRVVFLCGAGVSLNSGLPDFFKLTKIVVEFFDPPDDSEITASFQPWLDWKKNPDANPTPQVSLDGIFHLLQREYGRTEVNELVAGELARPTVGDAVGHNHKTISRISCDPAGRPQIVTTNFDTLFEGDEDAHTTFYVPPTLPDIDRYVPITGITYLHGRREDGPASESPYILSSSDFGRAYLSEGWATTFVRSLLRSYTVVLVGYQAEDPPVKYLLQGLNQDEASDRSNLFAFDRGSRVQVEAKWRDRGVTAIPYSGHDVLWGTLELWAERADNPREWKRKVAAMAQQQPSSLEAYQRGQVAHLVRSSMGAKLFANTEPSPHPEWVFVLDASSRAAEPSKGYGKDAELYDPGESYGLDDDPARPDKRDAKAQIKHDNMLHWRREDTNPADSHAIAGRQMYGRQSIPSRLYHLTRWIGQSLDHPSVAWWAARRNGLHPNLIDQINWHLRRGDCLHPKGRKAWRLILEFQEERRDSVWDGGWYAFQDAIDKDGWSPANLRSFRSLTSPMLSRHTFNGSRGVAPPKEGWDDVSLPNIAAFEIKFTDMHGIELEVPEEVLPSVLSALVENLKQASGMLADLETTYFKSPSCYPDRLADGDEYSGKTSKVIDWFLTLFRRQADSNADLARNLASAWPISDRYFLRKLKLFVLNNEDLFTPIDAFNAIQRMDQDAFWDTESRRELLFLISDRWNDFSNAERTALGDRLLSGPEQMSHWSDEEYPSIRDEYAARVTRWITLQGNFLIDKQNERLDSILRSIPNWNDGWATSYLTLNGSNVYHVGTDETPDALLSIPIDQVVDRAKSGLQRDFGSRTNMRPFSGLVKEAPLRALISLSLAARKKDYPVSFWTDLVTEWPDETTMRLQRQRLRRISRLPPSVVQELSHTLARWLESHLTSLLALDRNLAWETYDHIAKALLEPNSNATESALGNVTIGGEVQQRSRRTYSHALNSPIGCMTNALLRELSNRRPEAGVGIPDDLLTRLERLLTSPDEGRDHAVATISRDLNWLDHVSPEWVGARVIPWFAFDHMACEPAWSGLLSSGSVPTSVLRTHLRSHLLELFPQIYDYQWDRDLAKIAAQWISWMAVFALDKDDGVTKRDARSAIRRMNDATRCEVIHWLGLVGEKNDDGWTEHVIPFINTVWPRERIFQTNASVRAWVSMLEAQGGNFPILLKEVEKFLAPVSGETHWLYRFTKEIGGDAPLTKEYPAEVLTLMAAIVPNSPLDAPVELSEILEIIEEADSALTRDLRFFRLSDLVARQ
jgi:hypothetical protein